MAKLDWSRARRRPAQAEHDDTNDAAARWLREHERQADDGVEFGPWRRFKREFTEGWERSGRIVRTNA
jgi:hypothetical protein